MPVSASAKLLSTPIADLVRGRVTGAASYRVLLAEVGLPPALEDYAKRVVRKTRLRRRERIHAAEVVAVTLLEQTKSGDPAQVLQAQPKPRIWAKQLTREIVAQRGFVGRAWAFLKRKIAVTLAVFLVAYAVQFCRFYFQFPILSRNYAAEYNATIANLPDSDRAWDLLRQLGPITPDREHPLDKRWPDVAEGDPDWPIYVQWVRDHSKQLEMIRDASKRPAMGFYITDTEIEEEAPQAYKPQPVPSPTEDVFRLAWLMPYLGRARGCTRLLKADMRVAASEGDGARVSSDVIALLRLAELIRKPTDSIGDLLAVAIIVLATDTLAEIMYEYPGLMDDAELAAIAAQFSTIDSDAWLAPMLDSEVDTANDIIQRAWTDDGNGDGHFCGRGMTMFNDIAGRPTTILDVACGPVTVGWVVSRKAASDRVHEVAKLHMDYGRLPTWERAENPGQTTAEIYDSGKLGAKYLHVCLFFTGALTKAVNSLPGANMHRDMALVMIAMERYRLQHGVYPAKLDDLAPSLMPLVPLDAFDGDPLRYKLTVSGPILYSVGNNKQDEGGVRGKDPYTVMLLVPPRNQSTAADGDWVFWPPVPALQRP